MLCDTKLHYGPIVDIANVIAKMNGNSTNVNRLSEGVYQIGHFSFDQMIDYSDNWPNLDGFNNYGVCDGYEQVIEQCPELANPDRRFVMSVTPIRKASQSPKGGWRWHKWGPYIGKQKPTREYLYDEPEIEIVYCYHIYEL